MNCDASDESSCSDCKMDIIHNTWTCILIKWINKCVRPEKVCNTLSPSCLTDIMNKYKKDICDDDIDRAVLCTDDIEPFIRYKYPILRLRYLSEDSDYEKKQYIMTSVLLFHCCVKSHSGIVHEDIWRYMNKYEQEVILKFCERLGDMEITINNVDCAIKEAFDYVKYIQNISINDTESSTSQARANTEKVRALATSTDKIQEQKLVSTFNSSVTVLPSAITDTSTLSSLVTEDEQSTISCGKPLNNTNYDENREYRSNQFAEEPHRKPYNRNTNEGSTAYKVPKDKFPNIKFEVLKAGVRKRDLETNTTPVKSEGVRIEEPEKYIQPRLGKRSSATRKREDILTEKRQEILAKKRREELGMIDDNKHEFIPKRYEDRYSNEKQISPKLRDVQQKSKEFEANRRNFENSEKAKVYSEFGRIKHKVEDSYSWCNREARVNQKRRDQCGVIDEIMFGERERAVPGEDSSEEEASVENSAYYPKDKIRYTIEESKSLSSEDMSFIANRVRANRAETKHNPNKPKLQDKAKTAFNSKRYHILVAAGVLVICMLLIAVSIWATSSKRSEKDDRKEKSVNSKRYVRFISTQTPYQQKNTWICKDKICQITYNESYDNNSTYSSLSRCNLVCMGPQLWPYPTGYVYFSNQIVAFATNKLEYIFQSIPSEAVNQYLAEAFKLFISDLARLESLNDDASKKFTEDLTVNKIFIQIDIGSDPEPRLKLDTEESYNLTIDTVNTRIEVKIFSASFCGVRNGLQTLSQMILLDQTSGKLITVSNAVIKDGPSYKYRGLMIDTARNYIPVGALLQTIDAMATVKLNTFHWRISDVTSFPLYLSSIPMLFEYGGYTRSMVYTKEDVKYIVDRAGIRGIRVLIEIAAPGPVGRAWSWHPDVNCPTTNSINSTCDNVLCLRFGFQSSVMSLLQTLYTEILEMTKVNDIFHLSDGVFSLSNCYSLIEDRRGFLNIALKYLKTANKGTLPTLPIIWQTPHLDVDFEATSWERFGVQVTEMPNDQADSTLSKFTVIQSTKWDLSCEIKKQRCTRYRTWQEMYSWKSWRNIEVFSIEGGEAILWTDVVNSGNLETHLWPRAAAVAERLWSDAVVNNSVSGSLYVRLDNQRWRMIVNGVNVQPIWPLWCSLNPARCLESVR